MRRSLLVEAVSQTNGIGANQQRLGEPAETDVSGELLRASAGSGRLICLGADRCSWHSITNNFRSVTFAKQPPSLAEEIFSSAEAPARPAIATLSVVLAAGAVALVKTGRVNRK